jgi:hypothetical protein
MMHLNPLTTLLSISSQWFTVPIGVIMGAHDKFLCIHKKIEAGEFLLCHHSLWLWSESGDRAAVGISIGVILGFDVLVFPVGY